MAPDCTQALVLIEQARTHATPVFVAIDGRSGVGKSTFANALAAATGATLIEGDDFYAGGTELRTDTAEQRADACIDRAKLVSMLQQLKSGLPTTYRAFDWDAFDGRLRAPAITVRPANVVILEGVYAAHPDLQSIMQVRILLTAPDAVRMLRLIAREGSIGPWERQWHEAEDWYFAHIASAKDFNLIVR